MLEARDHRMEQAMKYELHRQETNIVKLCKARSAYHRSQSQPDRAAALDMLILWIEAGWHMQSPYPAWDPLRHY